MATIDVKDAANATQTLERPLPPGQAAMASSRPVVIASNQTAVPVSGTVTINAIPAGTANIGDVDIASIAAGTNTIGKIDQGLAHGTSRWLVDASISNVPAVTLSANNNNVRLNDSAGGGLTSQVRGAERALSVQLVDGSGNQVTSFGSGAVTYIEDTTLPADPQANALLARRRDTLTTAEVSADGDAIVLNATSKGQLHTLAQIDPAQLGAVGPQTKANSTSVTMATDEQIAHGTFDGGNPTKIGGKAYSTHPTYGGDQTRSNFITDRVGKQIAVNAIRELKGSQATQCVITGETIIIPAGGAGKFRDLYGLVMANTSSVTINATVRDAGGSGVVKSTWVLPPGDTRGFTLDAGSAMRQDAANNDWTVALSTLPSGSVHVTALWIENI